MGTDQVHRHRTALNRSHLSQPMSLLVSYGIIRSDRTILDYGCGRGDDLSGLEAAGYEVSGWDPHYRPSPDPSPSDVVNLGFVLNVIEDENERKEALARAWTLTKRVLSVAVMIGSSRQTAGHRPFKDGALTSRGTFQKYFSHAELRQYVSTATGKEPLTAVPGIVFVFRDTADEDDFLFERHSSRRRDVNGIISRRERTRTVARPPVEERVAPVLEEIAQLVLSRGRLPFVDELSPQSIDLLQSEKVSLQRASDVTVATLLDEAQIESAGRARREDLLVHATSSLLRARKLEAPTGSAIGRDIRSHFGNFAEFETQVRNFLFGLADADGMLTAARRAVEERKGLLDEKERFLASRSKVGTLPAELRTYIACATTLAEPDGEYVVRIEPEKRRVKFFEITDASKVFPITERQTIVDLKKQSIYDQSRRRVLVRKADLLGMGARAKQRASEEELRLRLLIGEGAAFYEID